MFRFFILVIALLTGPVLLADSADTVIGSRKDGGKVILAPTDSGGATRIMLESDPQTGVVKVPSGIVLEVAKLQANGGGQPEGTVPVGMVTPFAGTTAPVGWILCDGSPISRTTYANLHATLKDVGGVDSYGWGSGDGSTTFNVPNMVGQFLRGAGGSGPALAATQADSTSVNGLTSSHDHISQNFAHNHLPTATNAIASGGSSAKASSSKAHNHAWTAYGTGSWAPGANYWGAEQNGNALSTNNLGGGSHTHTTDLRHTHAATSVDLAAINTAVNLASMASTLGGDSETRPANIGVNYIIKY